MNGFSCDTQGGIFLTFFSLKLWLWLLHFLMVLLFQLFWCLLLLFLLFVFVRVKLVECVICIEGIGEVVDGILLAKCVDEVALVPTLTPISKRAYI